MQPRLGVGQLSSVESTRWIYSGGRPTAILARGMRLPAKPRCALKSTDTQIISLSPSKCGALPIKDSGTRRSPAMAGCVLAVKRGINKIELFLWITCRDSRAGLQATSKATMCPEINRYENYGPVPTRTSYEWRVTSGERIENRPWSERSGGPRGNLRGYLGRLLPLPAHRRNIGYEPTVTPVTAR